MIFWEAQREDKNGRQPMVKPHQSPLAVAPTVPPLDSAKLGIEKEQKTKNWLTGCNIYSNYIIKLRTRKQKKPPGLQLHDLDKSFL